MRGLVYIDNWTSEYYPDLKASTESLQKLWCEDKSEVPEDPDDVFFDGFEYEIKKWRIKKLRVFATSPRLISQMNENPDLVAMRS